MIKVGDKVKMSFFCRENMLRNGSHDHVEEFGDCIGIVIGPTDYNNCKPDDPNYDPAKVGPEVDVRWQPSNLRYAYNPETDLILVK
jgi:hypothetical protein